MMLGGLVAITTPLWAGSSHTMDGYNLVLVLRTQLWFGGSGLVACGVALLIRALVSAKAPRVLSRPRSGPAWRLRLGNHE